MLGFLGIFGRAESLKSLDRAFREFDVHPRTVPEAVKLAAVRLLQQTPSATPKLNDVDYKGVAELLGYAMLGHDQFIACNGMSEAQRAQHRLEGAIAAGEGLDAELILLALHSGIIHPAIADRFEIELSD